MRDCSDALLPEQLRQRRVRKRLAGNGRKDQPLAVRESSRLLQYGERSRSQRDLVLAPCLGSICRDGPDTGLQVGFPPLRQPDLAGPARRQDQELEGGLGSRPGPAVPHLCDRGHDLAVGQGGEMAGRSPVPRQGRVECGSGGIVSPVALGHRPAEDAAEPLLDAAHRLVLRCPVRQQHGHDVCRSDAVDACAAQLRQHVIAETVSPDLRRTSAVLPAGGMDRQHLLARLGERRDGAARIMPLGKCAAILQSGLASLRQRDDRKRAEPDTDGLAIDAQPLAPGPRMASELHRLDQQREPVAAPPVAVAPGPRHGLDERRGKSFRGSCSLEGYAVSYAFHGENAGNLSLPHYPITILVSVYWRS